MKIEYRKKNNKPPKVWVKIARDFNKGVAPQKMLNNPRYISLKAGRLFTTLGGIYYILAQMRNKDL